MAKRKKKNRTQIKTFEYGSTAPRNDDFEPVPPQVAPENRQEEFTTLISALAAPDYAATKTWRFELPEEELNAILLQGKFGGLKLIPWGSNYTFVAPLCDEATGQEYAVIYKPMRGEAPLWDFPNGTLYKREYCAYLVSRALGWNFVPPVVVRDGPHGIGTVQLFVDVDERRQYYDFQETHAHELKRIAIFDFITNNADRKAGHCLLGSNNMIWAIDHGICFNHVPKLRTVIWDFAGQPIPDDICQDLIALATDSLRLSRLRAELEEWLDRREIELFFERLEYLLNNPQFPGLTSRRQIPWGFF